MPSHSQFAVLALYDDEDGGIAPSGTFVENQKAPFFLYVMTMISFITNEMQVAKIQANEW